MDKLDINELLINPLLNTGLFPEVVPITEDTHAGTYRPFVNTVSMRERKTDPDSKRMDDYYKNQELNTYGHEMTHAAMFNLLEPAYYEFKKKADKTEQEKQFVDAIEKIFPVRGTGLYNLDEVAKKQQADMLGLVGSSIEDPYIKDYKIKSSERHASGVGDFLDPKSSSSHLAPTMVTELSILMDMYNRLPKDTKEKLVEKRKTSIATGKEYVSKTEKGK